MEYVDILDENGKLTGEVRDKDEAHKLGLWHREVGVWIINDKNEFLMQRRSPNKKFNPNKWAICAGHVEAGETMHQAAVRELEEELGVILPQSELKFLFAVRHENIENNGVLINNYYADVYIVKLNKDISEFKLQEDEVAEIKYIDCEEFKRMIEAGDKDTVFRSGEYMDNLYEGMRKVL